MRNIPKNTPQNIKPIDNQGFTTSLISEHLPQTPRNQPAITWEVSYGTAISKQPNIENRQPLKLINIEPTDYEEINDTPDKATVIIHRTADITIAIVTTTLHIVYLIVKTIFKTTADIIIALLQASADIRRPNPKNYHPPQKTKNQQINITNNYYIKN
jgi:hypothetical protein